MHVPRHEESAGGEDEEWDEVHGMPFVACRYPHYGAYWAQGQPLPTRNYDDSLPEQVFANQITPPPGPEPRSQTRSAAAKKPETTQTGLKSARPREHGGGKRLLTAPSTRRAMPNAPVHEHRPWRLRLLRFRWLLVAHGRPWPRYFFR